MDRRERLTKIIQHIKLVEDNCNKLASKLIDQDENFAIKLIQLGRMHDVSKFNYFEIEYLNEDASEENFKRALSLHHSKNKHHPECNFWENGIKEMSDVYLAEMVCDCVARGQEFGTDVRKFFYEDATKKYNFTLEDECGKKIVKYLDILLTKPFKEREEKSSTN